MVQEIESCSNSWTKLCNWIVQKYGYMDADDIYIKLDSIKQKTE
jgi:hypothetical protein